MSPEALAKGVSHELFAPKLSLATQRYTSFTGDREKRLRAHNASAATHTAKYRPGKLVSYLCFQDDRPALEFERYLKTGAGLAFANNITASGEFRWCESRFRIVTEQVATDPVFAKCIATENKNQHM